MNRSELPSEIAHQQNMSQAQQPRSLRRVSAMADLHVAFKQGRQDAARRMRQMFWRGSGVCQSQARLGKPCTSTTFSSSISSAIAATISDTTDSTFNAGPWIPAPQSHNLRTYADLTGAPRPDADIVDQISQEPWLTAGYSNLQMVTSAAHQAQRRRHRGADAASPAQSIEIDIDHFCEAVHSPADGIRQQIADNSTRNDGKRRWRLHVFC